MKGRLTAAVSLAAMIAGATLLPAGATAGGAHSNAPQDFVVGGGQNNPADPFPINHFAINAHSGPNGENPFGEVNFQDTESGPPIRKTHGPVVCMRVSGNLATIIWRFRDAHNEPPQFVGDLLIVADNGDPINGQPVDQVRNSLLTSIPSSCPPPMPPMNAPISHGNIQVHDAT